MALIKSCRGNAPQIPYSCWLAENSTIVGEVNMGENCSVWFNALIRGDVNTITFGDNVNIQDGAVIQGHIKAVWIKEDRKKYIISGELGAISKESLRKISSLTKWDKFILWVNRISNNHGLSIKRLLLGFYVSQ